MSQRYSCLHEVWRGNLILKIWSYKNPSNIWELNYRAQLWGANKFTGKMVLILQREEWISLFGHGTFQCYVFMLSTRFVRTWRNGLFHKTWRHLLFDQQLEAYLMLGLWWTCLRYDNFSLMLETEESISEIDSHHICKKRPSCDRERGPGDLSPQARW